MIVECFGLPGVGKSTLVVRLTETQGIRPVSCMILVVYMHLFSYSYIRM